LDFPYSDGMSAVIAVAALVLLFPYPLIAKGSRRHAFSALLLVVSVTMLSLVIHVGVPDAYQRVFAANSPQVAGAVPDTAQPKSVPGSTPVAEPKSPQPTPAVPKKTAPPAAAPAAAPATAPTIRVVGQDTALYVIKEGLFVPSIHIARQGTKVLVLPPGEGPKEEDFIEVLLPTPEGTHVPNWSPRGFMRERSLVKPSETARPQRKAGAGAGTTTPRP